VAKLNLGTFRDTQGILEDNAMKTKSVRKPTHQDSAVLAVVQGLRTTVKAAQRKTGAVSRLAEAGRGLELLSEQVSNHEATNISLIDALARSALSASQAASVIGRKNLADAEAFDAGLDLNIALARISQALVAAADSLRLPCGYKDDKTPKGHPFSADIAKFQMYAGQVAHRFFLRAANLNDAIGMVRTGTRFRWPAIGSSTGSCGGHPQHPQPTDEGIIVPQSEGDDGVDTDALNGGVKPLDEDTEELLKLLIALALLLETTPFAVVSACSSACTAGNWRIIVGTSGATAVGGRWQPYFTFDWEYCCQNLCWFHWTDEFWKSAGSTTHNLGGAFPASRKPQADGLAARGLMAAFNAWSGQAGGVPSVLSRPVSPAVDTPAAPGCGRIWA
jgi:hypothetical protein